MNAEAAAFDADWYIVKQAVLDAPRRTFLLDYALARDREKLMRVGDEQVSDAAYAYGDPEIDRLLDTMRAPIERATSTRLWPTFSYMRVYRTGNMLKAHRDRPACEVSITINIGMEAQAAWPIWISGPNGIKAVALEPGDGLIYRGCDCYHWRDPFEGAYQVQAFLHYVERDGARAEWKFDKRAGLSCDAEATAPEASLR
ncbi:hypothetical protein AB2M62_12005 [Sphingomonas sp. MMS12-HWE2-04]|uniref:hypothetical protein n=1 Tax=Sphingomonas sp. MMS12-HWE2-04 TaxID=3234199 RepID=UPI00384B4790